MQKQLKLNSSCPTVATCCRRQLLRLPHLMCRGCLRHLEGFIVCSEAVAYDSQKLHVLVPSRSGLWGVNSF